MFVLFVAVFILLLADQTFFNLWVVFNIGTNWIVGDIALLSLCVAWVINFFHTKKTPIGSKYEKIIYYPLIAFLILGIVAVIRGYSHSGTFAIGLSKIYVEGYSNYSYHVCGSQ